MTTISDAYDDLDQAMIDEEGLPDRLEDDATAERMMRALVRRQRQFDSHKAVVDAEKERLDEWLAERRAQCRIDDPFLVNCLRSYMAALRAQDPKLSTKRLPSGVLKATGGQPDWEYDEAVFLAWAKDHAPDLVRQPDPQINRADAKKILVVAADGTVTLGDETVPGVKVAPKEKTINVIPGA